jgi:hypothetical protein
MMMIMIIIYMIKMQRSSAKEKEVALKKLMQFLVI